MTFYDLFQDFFDVYHELKSRSCFQNNVKTITRSFAFCFVSSETKRIYFGLRVNYLHSGVKWPIEIVCNVNILEVEKQTCEHTIFKYRKTTCTKHKREAKISQIESFDDLSDFRLD